MATRSAHDENPEAVGDTSAKHGDTICPRRSNPASSAYIKAGCTVWCKVTTGHQVSDLNKKLKSGWPPNRKQIELKKIFLNLAKHSQSSCSPNPRNENH